MEELKKKLNEKDEETSNLQKQCDSYKNQIEELEKKQNNDEEPAAEQQDE